MEIWEAIVLGILQGLTEFLPVSSSGHLELANYFFGIEEPNNLSFTMAVHLGTVMSTIVVFWREIGQLFGGLFKFRLNDETIFIINLLISLLPVLFIGLMFREQIEGLFTSNLTLVGAMLLVTAGLLIFAQRAKPKGRPITPKNAFIMGIAQAVAVLPGLSRSGATISTGLMLGVKREEVSKFSFLMVLIPVIGMNLLDLVKGDFAGTAVGTSAIAAGFIAAFATGTLACRWMIRLVNRGKLHWFAVYCCAVGLFSIIYSVVNG